MAGRRASIDDIDELSETPRGDFVPVEYIKKDYWIYCGEKGVEKSHDDVDYEDSVQQSQERKFMFIEYISKSLSRMYEVKQDNISFIKSGDAGTGYVQFTQAETQLINTNTGGSLLKTVTTFLERAGYKQTMLENNNND